MTKYLFLLLPLWSFGSAVGIAHAHTQSLGKIIHTNAQITQLSNQKQTIVSRLGGHIEKYYVQAGANVKRGDKVILMKSITLSKLTADYLALKQQIKPASAQVNTTRKLYKKGLASKNTLSNHLMKLETLRSQKNALASQLQTLGIETNTLNKATDKFILKAHADGIVGKIFASLHSNVDAQTPLMSLVQQNKYYATAYLSPSDAMHINNKTKGWIKLLDHAYACHFVQLLPTIDEETQRAKVRFAIENSPSGLLLGSFVQMDISLPPLQNVIVIKKSALTLFNGEWVVFVEKKHEENEHEKEEPHHEKEAHKEDKTKHTHEKEEHHDEHDTHEEVPYQAKVIEVISYAGDSVAIKGLKENEAYVSDGVYFIKSAMLKSSLGEHGH
ncbi:MAG: hypothetical protein DSZ09_00150 [Sulfurovum sp.]|nr:MAG: hypothetical protein DSZ09_00150 [Sulfurovum sp.]